MKQRFSETQIIGFLREAEAGLAMKNLCRRHGFSEASYYLWQSKFGGLAVSDRKLPRQGDSFMGEFLASTWARYVAGGRPANASWGRSSL